MRVFNTDELSKYADPKDVERLTSKPEPEPDLQLQALQRMVDVMEVAADMQTEQRKILTDVLGAVKDKGDEKQIAALKELGATIVASMKTQADQMTAALSALQADTTQSDATNRLSKVVAILANEKSRASAEAIAKLDDLLLKIAAVQDREPVVNIETPPVVVEMPKPAREYRVNVTRTPQGLIDHAVIKRET